MGKRQRLRSRLKIEREFEGIDAESSSQVCDTFNSKRRYRKFKKHLRTLAKAKFSSDCAEVLVTMSSSLPSALPETIPHTCPDPGVLSCLSSLVNKYLDVFDSGSSRKQLAQFYSLDALLTFQIAPYLCNLDCKLKLLTQFGWSRYERFACNLICGAVPVPSWAWSELSCVTSGLPKSQRSSCSMGKHDKRRLKALRSSLEGHTERLRNISRLASSAEDRFNDDLPLPPMARSAAIGRSQIIGLLCRLPNFVHIKADECSSLDVISSEPNAVAFRYSCIAVELISETLKDSLSMDSHMIQINPWGWFFVRRMHRFMLIDPQRGGAVVQEDLCVSPVSRDFVQKHDSMIKAAVLERLSRAGADLDGRSEVQHQRADDLVTQLSSVTGMNAAYSLQCLQECHFALPLALDAFRKAMESKVIPLEAFSNN